jgi:integrase
MVLRGHYSVEAAANNAFWPQIDAALTLRTRQKADFLPRWSTKRAARVDVHLISHLLGHSYVLVTEKVYAKLLLPTLSKELNEKLSFLEFGLE